MLGRRLAAAALVRVAHFAPGLLKGGVYVVYVDGRLQLKGVPFKTVSDYLKVKPGKFKVEVREAGSGEVLAKADNLKLAGGSISSLAAAAGFVIQQRRSTG